MTEAALAANATAQAPAVIVQLLEKLAVPYQVRAERPGQPSEARLQAVLVDDAIGALLVLYPRSQMLDLSRLAELTGRQLTAVKPERLERMLGKHNLAALPGLPPLTSSPCLYEERLLQVPSLLIESGQPGVLLEIPTEAFKALLSKASAARFGEPVSAIKPNLDRPHVLPLTEN